ncbi:MAG: response regulator [Leptospiraceae bacterium]|nr:response regulator [Leptospiraceae bacterium]MCP5494729.1 response regulator [Leptospiraceae bacterium]
MNILVVDDSEMMRGIIKQSIEDNVSGIKLEFYEAENGQIALDTLNSKKIDLVFLDWNMPVLDGLSFVNDVRGRGIKTPIIMITSVTDEDKILEAGMAGVNTYIEKPVKGNKLWEQIKDFVK